MAIRIDFSNPNPGADSVVVYRSLTPIVLSALPAPLATLPGDATSFSDATAVRNKIYSYVIAIKKGDDTLFTQNQEYGYFPDTGPGPSTILLGNWREGYFGTCSQAELFAPSELINALAFSATAGSTSVLAVWHKFIIDGKILFIPLYAIGNPTLINLYDAGLIYGTDDNGLRPAGNGIGTRTGVNQKRTVTKNNRTYLVRLPKASTAPTDTLLTDLTAADTRWSDGEWNRTMGRLGYNAFTLCTRSRLSNWSQYTTNNASYTVSYTQHFTTPSAGIYFNGTATDVPGSINWATPYYAWRPVLELVL